MNSRVKILPLLFCTICIVSFTAFVLGQPVNTGYQKEIFWHLTNSNAIKWDLTREERLPHQDNIEMDGQLVAAIIHYAVDEKKQLHITRDILFPQLRRFLKSTDPEYLIYRAYLRDSYNDDVLPVISIEKSRLVPGILDSVIINGKIQFYHHPVNGLKVIRTFFPSMNSRLLVEKWTVVNVSDSLKIIQIGHTTLHQQETGMNGIFNRSVYSDAAGEISLMPSQDYTFGIYFTARCNDEPESKANFSIAEKLRDNFLDSMRSNLVLQTPDSILNTLFYFSKIRAAESIYQTKMGLVHSPGGGSYYTGIWANDQAEYSGPFFPYLGYGNGVSAAMNAYKMFLKNLPTGNEKIWASFEMNGDLPCCSKDRGDAAMIAFGATHFCLATGNKLYADTIWPLIEWCLAYCEKKKTSEGVIASQSDELEGRFPTGVANLSTTSLYYGALIQAADLAKAMGKPSALIKDYLARAKDISISIEKYFGAKMQGLHTYKYYKENTTLRSWICLPLVMGINQRNEGTLDALFNKLWTDNGVRIELAATAGKPEVFWDRGTLYSFRGAFKAGAADRALKKLHAYSKTRLTGFHVPYVVEAWPEGNMAHLSAESALYCRIYTEGILGLRPTGFHSFTLQPQLPADWNVFSIKKIAAFNNVFDVLVNRQGDYLDVSVEHSGKIFLKKKIKNGDTVTVDLVK
ncbi:MAG: six-hairpin glycosidase-like protein [Rhizobacter sp.]|nr:six-hairpin glycosidase-like protein [Ferruginibacter sp.]